MGARTDVGTVEDLKASAVKAVGLDDFGADAVPGLLLLNKSDRLTPALREELRQRYPSAVFLSAHAPADVAALRQRIIDTFEASMVDTELVIPYAKQALIGQIYENARVVSETFDETGRRLVLRALPAAAAKLSRLLADA